MSYCFSTKLDIPFEQAVEVVVARLKSEGFGVLSTIDVQQTLQQKLGVEFSRYTILGACNPAFAYQALTAEHNIGTMLPCNVVVREDSDGKIVIAAIDPMKSMQAVENPALAEIATAVQSTLRGIIESIDGEF
jgi:uncharacterized protein (DUF302 family)